MPKLKSPTRHKQKIRRMATLADTGVYHGKQARTGNSLGLRFDRALFHSHPEFNGEVEAHVISPGRMLVVAEPSRKGRVLEEDPVLACFMSFLAADMQRAPQRIAPLNSARMKHIRNMVRGVSHSSDQDLGDEALI